jgi:hypothetical protein
VEGRVDDLHRQYGGNLERVFLEIIGYGNPPAGADSPG